MKVLRANLHYELPAEFNGTVSDALRAAAEYLDRENDRDIPPGVSRGISHASFANNVRHGFAFTGELGIFESKDGGKWNRLDEPIPECNVLVK